jgi:O-antigen/teichoic acid export membrane protein
MTLKDKTIKGVKWTTFGSLFNAVLQIVQLAILARILSPSDFGLMAIVMVIIGFSNMFIDMGISNAIIYKQKVTENQLTSLYWLNVFVGLLLFLIIFIIAPFVALFYETPELTKLIILVGTTFLIQPFGQQFMILLQKELQFDNITKVQIGARLCSFLAIILFAVFDFGVLSLAYGVIIYSIVSTFFFIYNGVKIYRPKFYFRKKDLNEFLGFGLFQMGEKAVNYLGAQLDTILIGKLLGVELLGVYSVGKNLVSKPSAIINPVITKVTFPVMSKISSDTDKLRDVYVKTINYLTFVNTPVYLLIFLLARPLVVLLFGVGWNEAIPIVQILSIGFLLKSIGNPSGSLLLSKGKANIAFYWNLLTFILFPVFIYLGSFYGIEGVALSIVLIPLLKIYPNWMFIINRITPLSLKDYLNCFMPYLTIGLLSFIIGSLTQNINVSSDFLMFLFSGFVSIGMYFSLLFYFKKNIFLELINLFKKLL